MSTIATNILRDLEERLTTTDGKYGASTQPPSSRELLRELCEAAEGVRLGPTAWVFADGSELQV